MKRMKNIFLNRFLKKKLMVNVCFVETVIHYHSKVLCKIKIKINTFFKDTLQFFFFYSR